MRSESRGGAVVTAPSALGSKHHPVGPSAFPSPAVENPPGCIAAAEDPSAECGWEGWVACSRHDSLPRSPSTLSRNDVWKEAGVPTI